MGFGLCTNLTKLTDLHERVNTSDMEGFTREESNVKTRIDRIYARENDSKLVWTEVEVDHSITAKIHTDHSPVVVRVPCTIRICRCVYQVRLMCVGDRWVRP